MTVVTLYAVFANDAEATRIGRQMVDERLAACVNILGPCRSFYRWDGAVRDATEVPALFKTTTDRTEALVARLTELHSYDVPAIVAWSIERLPVAYAEWIEASLTG